MGKYRRIVAVAIILTMLCITINKQPVIARKDGRRFQRLETMRNNRKKKCNKDKHYIITVKNHETKERMKDKYKTYLENEISSKRKNRKAFFETQLSEEEADALLVEEDVLSIEEDTKLKANEETTTDVDASENTESEINDWNYQMIHMDEVAVESAYGEEPVKVAILDSGVDYSEDVDIWQRQNLLGDEASPIFEDMTGHGSGIAGIIGAKDNDEGITGMNPYAQLYSVRVLDENNEAPISRIIEGIYWAMEQNVDVINLSIGTSINSNALHQAIKEAYNQRILLVAAAGNTGSEQMEYPARWPEVLSVGSINAQGQVSDFSSSSPEVDVYAPGETVCSTSHFGGLLYTSGTSIAAPHVAGLASLLLQKNSNVTNQDVMRFIRETAMTNTENIRILDASYALSIFDEWIEANQGDEHEIEITNSEEPEVMDTDGIVEGRWKGVGHEACLPNDSSMRGSFHYEDYEIAQIKIGLRDIDEWWPSNYKAMGIYLGDSFRLGKTLDSGYFHGRYNFVSNYLYLARLAFMGLQYPNTVEYNWPALPEVNRNEIFDKLCSIPWQNIPDGHSDATQKMVLLGIAIHCATDAYAHSAYEMGGCSSVYRPINHPSADNADYIRSRHVEASATARRILERYRQPNGDILTYKVFVPDQQPSGYGSFRLNKLYSRCVEASGYYGVVVEAGDIPKLQSISWND